MASDGAPDGASDSKGLKITLTQLNPHFVCVLCFGYFIDATTITECMHTFCKSCIVNFLRTNHHCPHCDTLLSRTRPFSSLRADGVMQSLVYKTVPGLFQTEMRRRIHFYQSHPHSDFQPDVAENQKYVFGPEDSISLSIRYYGDGGVREGTIEAGGSIGRRRRKKRSRDPQGQKLLRFPTVRYFRCPATVPVSVLKSLIRTKYKIPEVCRVELLYGDEKLLDNWTLMEVAYIFQWERESPMKFSFQIFITRKVRRKRVILVRKVKSDQFNGSHPFGFSSAVSRLSDSVREPPLKIPRIEEPKSAFISSSSSERRYPLTPPETPDRTSECSFYHIGKSPSRSPSSRRDEPGSLKIVLKAKERSSRTYFYNKNNLMEDEVSNGSVEPEYKIIESSLEEKPRTKDFLENKIEHDEDCLMDDADSADYACDQDSEAPLEVDTSHETEPEADNEGEIDFGRDDMDPYHLDSLKDVDLDDEQGDSAIDVNETSASEVLDSDDKETDFNLSNESIEMDAKARKLGMENGDLANNKRIKSERNATNSIGPNAAKEQENSGESSDILDLSDHARTVRAQRESSQSPTSTSPAPSLGDLEKDAKTQDLKAFIASSQSLSMNQGLKDSISQQQNFLLKSNIGSLCGPNLLPVPPVATARPPLPLEWVRPPLVGGSVAHQTAAFNLMTFSHAVQLQLAMAAHAQAQVEAQKIQAQVQANVLKNLKASESLSFVNGSGDTLTISPIPNRTESAKSKLNTKPKTMKGETNTLNKNTMHKSKLNLINDQACKDMLTPTDSSTSQSAPVTSQGTLNSTATTYSSVNASSFTDQIHDYGNAGIKTIIPKSALSSLKIPTVPFNTRGNLSKMDKKLEEKDTERTGDPVFKITNQKLIDFVRQQHLHKLKQTKQHSSSEGQKTSCASLIPKPTLAVMPTSLTGIGNKTNSNSVNRNINNIFDNTESEKGKKTKLNNAVSTNESNGNSQMTLNKPQVTSTNKPHLPSAKSVSSPNRPQSAIAKSQISNVSKLHLTSVVSKPLTSTTVNKQVSGKSHNSVINKLQPAVHNKPPSIAANRIQSNALNKLQPTTISNLHPNAIIKLQHAISAKPQPSVGIKPQSTTLYKPHASLVSKSQCDTINKSQSPQVASSKSPPTTFSNSASTPVCKPQVSTAIKSQSPTNNISKPHPSAINRNHSTTIEKLQATAISKSPLSDVGNPEPVVNNALSANTSKPQNIVMQSTTSQQQPAIKKPQTHKSIVFNKSSTPPHLSPTISLNKISTNMLNNTCKVTASSSTTTATTNNNNSVSISANTAAPTINVSKTFESNGAESGSKFTAVSFTPKPSVSSSPSIRTTNTYVRQIPNPSRLHHQSESRLNRVGLIPKKGVTASKSEGMSRIESLTRSLHEKVAASNMAAAAGVTAGGVLNSLAR